MAETQVAILTYSIRGDLRPLERDLQQVQTKYRDSKRRIEADPVRLRISIDERSVREAKAQVERSFANQPLKIRIDAGDVRRQLEAVLGGRVATGGATLSSAVAPALLAGGAAVAGAGLGLPAAAMAAVAPRAGSAMRSYGSPGVATSASPLSVMFAPPATNTPPVPRGFWNWITGRTAAARDAASFAAAAGAATPDHSAGYSVGGKQCRGCGKINPPGTNFCIRCGGFFGTAGMFRVNSLMDRVAHAFGMGSRASAPPATLDDLAAGQARQTAVLGGISDMVHGGIHGSFMLPEAFNDAFTGISGAVAAGRVDLRRGLRQAIGLRRDVRAGVGRVDELLTRGFSGLSSDVQGAVGAGFDNLISVADSLYHRHQNDLFGYLGPVGAFQTHNRFVQKHMLRQTRMLRAMWLRGRGRRGGGSGGAGGAGGDVGGEDIADLPVMRIAADAMGVPRGPYPYQASDWIRGPARIGRVRWKGVGSSPQSLFGGDVQTFRDHPGLPGGSSVGAVQAAWLPAQIMPWLAGAQSMTQGPLLPGGHFYNNFAGSHGTATFGPMPPSWGQRMMGWGARGAGWLGAPVSGEMAGNINAGLARIGMPSLGSMGVTNGAAAGAGALVVATLAGDIAYKVQNRAANRYASGRGLEIDPTFANVSSDQVWELGKGRFTDLAEAVIPDTVLRAGEGLYGLFGGTTKSTLTRELADERAAEQRRDIRFQARRRSASGRSRARVLGAETAVLGIGDEYMAQLAGADVDVLAVEEDVAQNGREYGRAASDAMVANAQARRAKTRRNVARQQRTAAINSGLSAGQLALAGINDRQAARLGIMAGYTDRLNSPTASVVTQAATEMNAALASEARLYGRQNVFMSQGNRADFWASFGYDHQAALIRNASAFDQNTAGLNRSDPLQNSRYLEFKAQRENADRMAGRQLTLARRDLADSTAMGYVGMLGLGLGAQTAAINQQRQTALLRSPEMAAEVNAQFDQQVQGAAVNFQMARIGAGLVTGGLNQQANRQRMLNRGSVFGAEAQNIVDATADAIMRANIEFAGPGRSTERRNRISALRNVAGAQLEGISERLRYGNRGEVVSAYQGRGDGSNLAYQSLGEAQAIAAGAAGVFDQAERDSNATGSGQGSTSQQAQEMITLLQKIADRVGIN